MTRPCLTYVDSTILGALIGSGPISEAVRCCFQTSASAWVCSEIGLARTLLALDNTPIGSSPLDLEPLLHALIAGIAIRPLPLRQLTGPVVSDPRLSRADALELAAACLWRCSSLISNAPALRQAAQTAGLLSFGFGDSPTAAMGDWPRPLPIPP
jgi:hypothetical protein